jgi:S-formylglutathione hydrolase FrmB
MALCELNWFSNVLQKQVATRIILPDVGKGPYATFYLLHGLSDDHTIWHRRSRIEEYVKNLPLIVVMPDGYRGFYTDNNEGPAYAKFFGEELPAYIERTFDAKSSRSARCVGGLSMGGYGALRIGLGYPEMFSSVNSHSGALMRGSQWWKKDEVVEFTRVFGKNPEGTSHDLRALAQRCKKNKTLPKILIDCGVDDFLIEQNREYHAALNKMGIEHEYFEFPGAHTWDYWDEHVRDALKFHIRNLKIKAHP